MGDFFKQFLIQISDVWRKLSVQQQVIVTALTALMFVGLLLLAAPWSASDTAGGAAGGYKRLYSNLPIEDLANVEDALKTAGFKYKISNNGTAIDVEEKAFYDAKMSLARQGIPATKGVGWELFDTKKFGDTDFEMKVKAKRALEGELTRTIKSIAEIEEVRVHLTLAEGGFLEEKKPAKAAIAVKVRSGRSLNRGQIDAIAYLAANSVEGLETNNVSIVDYEGRVLLRPADEGDVTSIGGRNMEMKQSIERSLKNKVEDMFTRVLGPGKVSVEIDATLDFNKVESTLETFNPESRVTRSEERIDMSARNAPDGDRMNEVTRANYEIDRKLERIVHEVGTVKRLSVSVFVDGRYVNGEKGEKVFTPRTPEEIANYETMVKNAVGYDLTRGDQVAVIGTQFNNELQSLLEEGNIKSQREGQWTKIINYAALFLIVIIVFIMLRSVAKSLSDAMNPLVPEVEIPNLDEDDDNVMEVPPNVARSNELLEKVEIMTENDPQNVARIIKDWLNEPITKKD